MKQLLLIFVFGLLFSSGFAGPIDMQIDDVLEQYFKIQQVLSQDTTQGIDPAAAAIVGLVEGTSSSDPEIQKLLAELKQAGQAIQGKGLEAARNEFFNLSKPLLVYLHQHYSGDETYFRYYCGMVNKGWVQPQKDVRNPYHGSSMLTCGELIG